MKYSPLFNSNYSFGITYYINKGMEQKVENTKESKFKANNISNLFLECIFQQFYYVFCCNFKIFFNCFKMISFLMYNLKETIKVFQPLLISGILQYFQGLIDFNTALIYAIALSLSVCVCTVLLHPYLVKFTLIGMKIRIAVSGLIYKKVAF